MTDQETINEVREICTSLPSDDAMTLHFSHLEKNYYCAKALNHGLAMELALAKIRTWIIHNRHRCTELIMDL